MPTCQGFVPWGHAVLPTPIISVRHLCVPGSWGKQLPWEETHTNNTVSSGQFYLCLEAQKIKNKLEENCEVCGNSWHCKLFMVMKDRKGKEDVCGEFLATTFFTSSSFSLFILSQKLCPTSSLHRTFWASFWASLIIGECYLLLLCYLKPVGTNVLVIQNRLEMDRLSIFNDCGPCSPSNSSGENCIVSVLGRKRGRKEGRKERRKGGRTET
jgi:hypothetical protein